MHTGPNRTLIDIFSWNMIMNNQVDEDDVVEGVSVEYFMVAPSDPKASDATSCVTGDFFKSDEDNNSVDTKVRGVFSALPDRYLSCTAEASTDLPPAAAKSRPQDGVEDRFPLMPSGGCIHGAHWNHVRAKRSYSFYKCNLCSVQWRQLRPKVALREVNKKQARGM
jgi:hypothetical protein